MCVCAKSFLSCLTLCDSMTAAHQAPLSMGFFRQEYWSGLPFPSPGELPDPRIEPRSPALQADALRGMDPLMSLFKLAVPSPGSFTGV